MRQSTTVAALSIRLYYAATVIFLVLDCAAGINVQAAFLEPWPAWRGACYGLCFGRLLAIAWRPTLTTLVTTTESLITLSALIVGMRVRAMTLSTTLTEQGGSFISPEQIVNVKLAGCAA